MFMVTVKGLAQALLPEKQDESEVLLESTT